MLEEIQSVVKLDLERFKCAVEYNTTGTGGVKHEDWGV